MRTMYWRSWVALLAASALLAAIGWLAGPNPTQADEQHHGAVSMDAAATVMPGGEATVDLVATPEPCVATSDPQGFTGCLAVWLIKVEIVTPGVVSVASDGCTPLADPGGAYVGVACGPTTPDNSVFAATGVFLWEDTNKGLETRTTLAAMTFHADGSAGQCSDLKITVVAFLDPNGNQLNPTVTDGRICIMAGQQRVWGDIDCNGFVDPLDSLKDLVFDSGGTVQKIDPSCPDAGSSVQVGTDVWVWGDIDCNGFVDPLDSLKALVFDSGGTVQKIDPSCPDAGSSVQVY